MTEQGISFSKGVIITRMRADHLDGLAALESEAFSRPWSRNALAEELTNPLAVFFVAEDAGTHQVIGYLGMFHVIDEGDISNLAVSAKYRRQGVASALMNEATAYAQGHQLTRLTLEVRVSNAAAIGLYEAFGFLRDGFRPGFYEAPKEDAAIYSLYL